MGEDLGQEVLGPGAAGRSLSGGESGLNLFVKETKDVDIYAND